MMSQKETRIEPYHALEDYGIWLLAALRQQGITLSVVGESSLYIKGKMTLEQKENIRLWKRHLINALSPKCQTCTLPMKLIDDGKLWFCPFGCQSREVEKK